MVAQALFNWAVKNAKNYTPETVADICAQVELSQWMFTTLTLKCMQNSLLIL